MTTRTITSGSWTRIGDNPFGLGIKRFEDGDKKPLWRFHVTKNPNVPVIDIDCRASDLREIMRFCETAITELASDGGRDAKPETADEEPPRRRSIGLSGDNRRSQHGKSVSPTSRRFRIPTGLS